MNQFGCPFSKDPKSNRSGTGGPKDGSFKNIKTGATESRFGGGNIKDENIDKTSNAPGTLSMANTGRPNSGGSQFFMNVANNKNLDWFTPGQSKHPVFGALDAESLALAVKISKVQTRSDNPVQPIKMISVTVDGGASAGSAASAAPPKATANPIATLTTSMGALEAEIFLDRVPRTASNFIDLAQSGFFDGLHFHRVIPGFMNVCSAFVCQKTTAFLCCIALTTTPVGAWVLYLLWSSETRGRGSTPNLQQFGCPFSRDPRSNRSGTGGPKDGTFKNLATGATETRSNGGNIKDENIDKTSNAPGTLSMANTGEKNSGGSQFFLNVAKNNNLDWFSPGESKHPVFGKLIGAESMALAKKISEVKTKDDNPLQPIKMISVTVRGLKSARDDATAPDSESPPKKAKA